MGQLEEEDYEIKVTMTMQTSILYYFSQAQNVLKNFNKYLNRHRELDFLKMRRFLLTTYNSLCDIDPHFKNKELIKLYENMRFVASVYDEFAQKSRLGVRAYPVVFLQQQERYTLFEGLLQHNLKEIDFLRTQTLGFKQTVQKYKDNLANLQKQSTLYYQSENELKELKRRENSTIMRLGEIQEQNEIISVVLSHFRDAHETEFLLMYQKFTQSIKPKLLSILNAMAFEFDVEIWLRANRSKVIETYFKNSYTTEPISSKIYLAHYLKGLDKNKLSEEHKELQTLLDYLNHVSPVYCVIYMPSKKDLDLFQSSLEADNNGLIIQGFTDAKVALTQAFKRRIDILILDLDADSMIIENFLSLYRKNSMQLQKQARIMLVCNEVNDISIAKADMLGSDSLIERNEDAYEIIDMVYDLLRVDTTSNE